MTSNHRKQARAKHTARPPDWLEVSEDGQPAEGRATEVMTPAQAALQKIAQAQAEKSAVQQERKL